jgi:chemotaxis protein methyltransferase CheR
VCKRLGRRLGALGVADLDEYRDYLKAHPEEWDLVDKFCRIPISRFYRDRDVFDALHDHVLPGLARAANAENRTVVRCWCAGAASGEEVFTLKLIWTHRVQNQHLRVALFVLGTDADPAMIARAKAAVYSASSLSALPADLRDAAFEPANSAFHLRNSYRAGIEFEIQDIRVAMPPGPFEIILCRNLAFTYFSAALQRRILAGLLDRLSDTGILVIGKHERLPHQAAFRPSAAPHLPIYEKTV